MSRPTEWTSSPHREPEELRFFVSSCEIVPRLLQDFLTKIAIDDSELRFKE